MASAASQPPVRNPSGGTSDAPWQPLADCGAGNPFFYHSFFDDFDSSLAITGFYTKTITSTGTIANAAGDGGLILFTTTAGATDIASLQLPAANFSLTKGKKLFFECRLQISSAANAAFLVGLIQTTTTPFTVVDGIYFLKASGATALTINSSIASVNTAVTIPAGSYTLADATFIDLAFYLDRNGDIQAFVDSQLVGFVPQSGVDSVNPNNGPVARIPAPSLATVNLNPTLAIQAGTGTVKTMTADFFSVQKER